MWRNGCDHYVRPLPAAIGVSARSCSLPLQRAVCDLGMESSFHQAAKRVGEHYGFMLPLSAVADISRTHAAAITAQQQARDGAHRLPAQGAATIVAEADGSFLRIVTTDPLRTDRRKSRKVGYREVRLCAASAQGSDRICYEATFDAVQNVAPLWSCAAKNAGMGIDSKVHILSDGAEWIHTQGEIAFGRQGTHLIDLYHVLTYLHEAAPACALEPQRWVQTQKRRLQSGHADQVIAALQKHLEPDTSPDPESPVRRAYRYLDNRRDCLAYDQAIARKLPLGSGMIESGNKHLLQARMKIPGASWKLETAENFVQARALRANGGWDDYWKKCTQTAA